VSKLTTYVDPVTQLFSAVNGALFQSEGLVAPSLGVGFARIRHPLHVANVNSVILGSDLFDYYRLAIDYDLKGLVAPGKVLVARFILPPV